MLGLFLPAAQQLKADEVSFDFFYNNLNDGNWVEVGDYGYCWQPNAAEATVIGVLTRTAIGLTPMSAGRGSPTKISVGPPTTMGAGRDWPTSRLDLDPRHGVGSCLGFLAHRRGSSRMGAIAAGSLGRTCL